MEQIPWFVQLGVAGGSIALVLGTFIWLIKAFSSGKFQTAAQSASIVDAIQSQTTQIVALEKLRADEQIAQAKERMVEWRTTAQTFQNLAEVSADAAKQAIESNRIIDHFITSQLPHLGEPKAPAPGAEE